jgi:hypothetical protein
MRPRTDRPCWATVNDEALRPDRLARVLVEMGFGRSSGGLSLGATTRGAIALWQPEYLRGQAAFHHGRDRVAAMNRAARDAEVRLLARAIDPAFRVLADGRRYLITHEVYMLDTTNGEWRSSDGAQIARDLISLGMLLWGCRYGQAGARIARVAGFRVPVIPAKSRGLFHAA